MQIIDDSAELLYGLIHARYILTTEGMNRMVRRGWLRCAYYSPCANSSDFYCTAHKV